MPTASPALLWPNLFIVGAMKCGTTSLHAYLADHPQICMSRVKEPSFFTIPEPSPEQQQAYLALFEQPGDARYRGEASTDYTKQPLHEGVVERIAARAPDARIVYLVRHPFERMVSHYWYDRQHNRLPVTQGLVERVTSDPQFREITRYGRQIRPYIDAFGRDNVLILVLEEMQRDMRCALARIHAWLGVAADPAAADAGTRHNVRPEAAKVPSGRGILYRLRRTAAWSAVAPVVPKPLRSTLSALSTQRVSTRDEAQVAELRRLTRDFVDAEIEDLSRLVGRDLSTVWPHGESR